ncbi:sporulation protein YunB [Paenibacillus popilliae]|uniref:Sporulation protein YunB n=1 Tax=Paenibacillus popilliae TaxID=78057 RepID=A0ABY3AJP1_PAEPP|nr:sporulation protein YunB [Paenibacillus sp. SDF0028]TQR42252.1 sporulation protein YunB [Paenibacillus sp. SDF0028]
MNRWRSSGFRARRWRWPKISWSKRRPGWRASGWRPRPRMPVASQSEAKNAPSGWSSRQSKPKRKRRAFFIALVIFTLLTVQLFVYVDRNVKGPLMHLAKIRVKQIATQAINRAITDQVMRGRELDKLIEWKTDSRGKVTSFVLNYNEHMRITSETVDIVESSLKNIHEISDKIPLGQALGSPLIASFGPRIPVKMEPQGAVKVELNTRPMDVGINMVLVEVYIKVTEEVAIVIPFDLEPEVVETQIPISYLLVVGDVPMYYYDGKGQPVGANREKAPALSLPMQSVPSSGGSGSISSGSKQEGITVPTQTETHADPTAPAETGDVQQHGGNGNTGS